MLTTFLHTSLMLLMTGLGLSPGAASPSRQDTECVTQIDVSSSVDTSGNITVTATPDQGSACTMNSSSTECTFGASSNVTISYHKSSNRFEYDDTTDGTRISSPTTSIGPGSSVDFGVLAAYKDGNDDPQLAWLPDPKITVQTGSCNDADHHR